MKITPAWALRRFRGARRVERDGVGVWQQAAARTAHRVGGVYGGSAELRRLRTPTAARQGGVRRRRRPGEWRVRRDRPRAPPDLAPVTGRVREFGALPAGH